MENKQKFVKSAILVSDDGINFKVICLFLVRYLNSIKKGEGNKSRGIKYKFYGLQINS
jgi:hypothetical protein